MTRINIGIGLQLFASQQPLSFITQFRAISSLLFHHKEWTLKLYTRSMNSVQWGRGSLNTLCFPEDSSATVCLPPSIFSFIQSSILWKVLFIDVYVRNAIIALSNSYFSNISSIEVYIFHGIFDISCFE